MHDTIQAALDGLALGGIISAALFVILTIGAAIAVTADRINDRRRERLQTAIRSAVRAELDAMATRRRVNGTLERVS